MMIFHHRGHVCQKSARAFHGLVVADLPVGSLDSPSACFQWTQPRRQFRYGARLLCYFRPCSNLMQSYQVVYGGFEDLVELTASVFRISPDKARWPVKRSVEYIAGSSDNPRPYPQDFPQNLYSIRGILVVPNRLVPTISPLTLHPIVPNGPPILEHNLRATISRPERAVLCTQSSTSLELGDPPLIIARRNQASGAPPDSPSPEPCHVQS